MTEKEFIEYLKKINIKINDEQLKQFDRYYQLLIEWNEKINLTSIIDKKQVYLKHFYDSATIAQVIDLNNLDNLCDVGTGAGFPGLVLKILYPNINVTLIDSLNKRIKFLEKVIVELGLKKVEVIHARVEEYAKNNREKFDVVTARAVAPLNILLEYCLPLVKVEKYFIPMKGNISQEIGECQKALKILNGIVIEKKEFLLPIENSHRTILKIKKMSATSNEYPRKNSEIKKRPL